ncbi:MAG: HRDC domain-containing protein [Verrucomicrobia bacterium]|nr:HRDC domain-containing protein [Verrucomicrobiota bacterium]
MIDTDTRLAEFLPQLSSAPWLAFDTEADSLHAYPEKICLMQISIPGRDVLIDPLARLDLAPLLAALSKHELLMHGADYDLRLLRRGYNYVPGKIFDTMPAARLLGETQFGLVNLAEKFLGVKLDKGPQKADWARRPLTDRMANYARHDTHYLHEIVGKLRAALKEKGRLEWHAEICARLIRDCSVASEENPDEVWRIKGCFPLDPRGLAVLRELWHWREQEAIAANRPPFFVLSHEALLELAIAAANDEIELPIPHHVRPGRRDRLVDIIHRALALPAEEWPERAKHTGKRPSEADLRRCDKLKAIRDRRAKELGIDATLIAPKATLLELAQDWEKHSAELMNWQRELMK